MTIVLHSYVTCSKVENVTKSMFRRTPYLMPNFCSSLTFRICLECWKISELVGTCWLKWENDGVGVVSIYGELPG